MMLIAGEVEWDGERSWTRNGQQSCKVQFPFMQAQGLLFSETAQPNWTYTLHETYKIFDWMTISCKDDAQISS